MNSSELGTILNIPPRTIRDKTKKASELNQNSIKLNDRFFKIEMVSGHYAYEEIFAEVVDTSSSNLSATWLLASEEKQEEAILKQNLVRDYKNRPGKESWKKFLERVERKYKNIKPTKSKLFRWLATVEACEKENKTALEYLLDTRGKSSSNRSYSKEMYEYLEKLILENPEIRTTLAEDYMKMEFGKKAPSYATINRMIQHWKDKNVLVYEIAKDPDKAVGKLRPAPGRADENITRVNQLWELDATPADVICSDGIRYTLSAVLDVFSRRVVVVVEPTASYTTLGKALKKAVQKFGVPEVLLTDQGADYKSNNFEYTCSRLRAEHRLTPPYSGWAKPHVERFFGTLTRDLFEACAGRGYVGHNVADKQRIQNRLGFDKKLAAQKSWAEKAKNGDVFAKRFAKKKENAGLTVEIPLSREELESHIDRWIKQYEHKRHRGLNKSPMERWRESVVPARTVSDERVLDMLVGLSVKKKITKKGVTWNRVSYWDDLLYDRVSQSVWVLSDDNLGYVYLYDMEMKFICKAESPELLGKSRSEYMAGLKFSRRIAKERAMLAEKLREIPHKLEELMEYRDKAYVGEDETEVALEFKTEITSSIRESIQHEKGDDVEEETEILKDTTKETLVVNGRPVFTSLYERFYWDLENDKVDHDTKRLAAKNQNIWELAESEWQDRKIG